MHLSTRMSNNVIHLHCSVTGNEVARIKYLTIDGRSSYLTEYVGPMEGLPGRVYNVLQAAEYGCLSEYLNKFG